jgi:transcriptional regulator of acetoin/glycerol metabolism
VESGVVEWLVSREWPGNLGELERTIQRAVDHSRDETLRVQDFSSA